MAQGSCVLKVIIVFWLLDRSHGDHFGVCNTCGNETHYETFQMNSCTTWNQLIYFCCDGVPRYCISNDPNCYWKDNRCPSKYSNRTCQLRPEPDYVCDSLGIDRELLAWDPYNYEYWYCDNATKRLYFLNYYRNPSMKDKKYAPLINDMCTSSQTSKPTKLTGPFQPNKGSTSTVQLDVMIPLIIIGIIVFFVAVFVLVEWICRCRRNGYDHIPGNLDPEEQDGIDA